MKLNKSILIVIVTLLSLSLMLIGCGSEKAELEKQIENVQKKIEAKEAPETTSKNNKQEQSSEEMGYETYKAELTEDMMKEAKALEISNDKIVEIVTLLTVGDAKDKGMSIEEYLGYINGLGLTPFLGAKNAAAGCNMTIVQVYELTKMAEEMGTIADQPEDEIDPEIAKIESIQHSFMISMTDYIDDWQDDNYYYFKYRAEGDYDDIIEWFIEDLEGTEGYSKTEKDGILNMEGTYYGYKIELIMESLLEKNTYHTTIKVAK